MAWDASRERVPAPGAYSLVGEMGRTHVLSKNPCGSAEGYSEKQRRTESAEAGDCESRFGRASPSEGSYLSRGQNERDDLNKHLPSD